MFLLKGLTRIFWDNSDGTVVSVQPKLSSLSVQRKLFISENKEFITDSQVKLTKKLFNRLLTGRLKLYVLLQQAFPAWTCLYGQEKHCFETYFEKISSISTERSSKEKKSCEITQSVSKVTVRWLPQLLNNKLQLGGANTVLNQLDLCFYLVQRVSGSGPLSPTHDKLSKVSHIR